MRIDRISAPQIPQTSPAPSGEASESFQSVLEDHLRDRGGVEFTRHALERLQQRGIEVTAAKLGRLNESVHRAESKGSKTTLVLLGDLAFVVSVENKKVVTVADQSALKEHVFTNIDSVVVG